MSFHPRNVLVTGGAGFIGASFVHYLLQSDLSARIVNLDLLTYAGNAEYLDDVPDPYRHRLVQGDICDATLLDTLFQSHDIDTVVHFAAESHVDRSINAPGDFVRTNVLGTHTLLEAARRHWVTRPRAGRTLDTVRFHHVSTDEVFGSLGADDPSFTEATAYAPNSPYSASKAASDHLVRAYAHTYGLPVTTTHCSNNYGPFQHREKFIPTVINRCIERCPIPVYGTGRNVRDWLYVEDHCRGIERVLRNGVAGETYNIGGGNELTNLGVAHRLCALMDELRPEHAPHAGLIRFVEDRPGHDWRYAVDFSKARRQLRWRPRESLDSGLRKTVDWYLARIPAHAPLQPAAGGAQRRARPARMTNASSA
jgi:dTDP-glucose 4,6-dehydratase